MKNKNYKKGTTLTEMMIYLSLFVVVSFLVYQFFNTIFTQQNLKNTLKSEKIIQETENIIDEIIKNGTDIQIANNGITLTP
jgi:type II secretory pathway component PulJ